MDFSGLTENIAAMTNTDHLKQIQDQIRFCGHLSLVFMSWMKDSSDIISYLLDDYKIRKGNLLGSFKTEEEDEG